MDPDAPLAVAQGTVITSAVATTIASAYGTFKGYNLFTIASATALNSGIAAATFFSCREYVVSPILLSTISSGQFLRRSREVEQKKEEKKGKQPQRAAEPLSWSDMRLHKLPDTAISSAITGGVLNAWKRGPAGIIPGAITATFICSCLQLGYNELGVMRIKYVSRKLQETPQVQVPTSQREVVIYQPQPQPTKPVVQRILEWMGMPAVSDEEFLRKLKAKREDILRQIAKIEADKAREAEREAVVDEKEGSSA